LQRRELVQRHRVGLGQCAQPFPFRLLPLVQIADVRRQRGRVYGGETRKRFVALPARTWAAKAASSSAVMWRL
jgi:hypothetical protein